MEEKNNSKANQSKNISSTKKNCFFFIILLVIIGALSFIVISKLLLSNRSLSIYNKFSQECFNPIILIWAGIDLLLLPIFGFTRKWRKKNYQKLNWFKRAYNTLFKMPPIGIIKNSICIAVTMFQWIFIIQIIAVPVIVIVKTYTTNMFSISLIRPVNILCNSFKQIIDKTSNISINPTIILLNVYFVIFLLITFFSILFYLKHNSDKQNQPKTKKFPLKDAPLEKDDNYEPKGTLESLKQFIFDMSGESNQCLLLDGPWGSGKTSLIYQLHTKETPQHSNESTNENYIIYLNSWHLSNIHELITEIRNEIYRLCSRAFIAVPHNLIRYINIICDGAGGIRQTIANAIRENDTAKNIKQEREELDLLISRTNEILGYNNIIIVFDELERIYDENKIHNIVGFIHYLRDLHIPIIVSCNFNEIKYKFIKNVPDTGFKSDQNPFTPSPHFWEKIFTIQFPMISPMPAEKASHLINKYFDHEMKEYLDGALQNKWHTDELNEIFATVHTILRQDSVYRFFRNYRQIKLFVNKFIERGISLKQALSKETKISDQIDIDALVFQIQSVSNFLDSYLYETFTGDVQLRSML